MRALSGLALIAVLVASSIGCAADPKPVASAPSPLYQKPLPDFQRRTLSGQDIDTKALRGRIVVVKFFAKYCAPCQRTLPAAQALQDAHPEITVIGIAEDESRADVDETIARYRLSFPVVHDRGNVLSGRFRVREMPATFVADASGIVTWVGAEAQTETDLESAVSDAGRR